MTKKHYCELPDQSWGHAMWVQYPNDCHGPEMLDDLRKILIMANMCKLHMVMSL